MSSRLPSEPASRTVAWLAVVVLVVLAVVLPISIVIGGPVLLSIGVLGRREAKAVGASTTAYDVALVAGIVLILVAVAVATAALLLLPVRGGTNVLAPSEIPRG